MPKYPKDACAPSGENWWQLKVWPGTKMKFGAEPKIAAWIKFNAQVGDTFTIKELRKLIGDSGEPNTDEHFNRRFRSLRKYGWSILSSRDDSSLATDEYRLERIGGSIWLGKAKHSSGGVSDRTRREVFDADGHRCVLCGIGSGEPYPDNPSVKARLTVGHFVAGTLHGSSQRANLRTECSRCNEPMREEAARSESSEELWPKIRSLKRDDKKRLLSRGNSGCRQRDDVDRLFDQYRALPEAQRQALKRRLERAAKS